MDALSSPTTNADALLSKGEHTGSGNEGECRTTNDVFNEVRRNDGLRRIGRLDGPPQSSSRCRIENHDSGTHGRIHVRHRQGDIPLRSKAVHHVFLIAT